MLACCCTSEAATVTELPSSTTVDAPAGDGALRLQDDGRGSSLGRVVAVRKQDTGLGLEIDVCSIGIQVSRIGIGAVRTYNASVDESRRVEPNDLILEVNGATEPKAMAERINEDEELTLRVVHLERREVTIHKKGEQLGLTLLFHEIASACLFVKEIGAGAVKKHNESAAPEDVVWPQDFIASVNGQTGRGHELLQVLKASNSVELVLLRMPRA